MKITIPKGNKPHPIDITLASFNAQCKMNSKLLSIMLRLAKEKNVIDLYAKLVVEGIVKRG